MFFRQGIDIVENKRIEKLLEKYKDKFKKKILSNDEILDINEIKSFDYKVIGYRAGMNDSSVILKKGNKEYFVSQGEKLEGIYELIEVNQNEIIFRENEKLYRINNLVGK